MNKYSRPSGESRFFTCETPAQITDHDVRYTSPPEHFAEDTPQHTFELIQNDSVIGGAEIDYFSRPLPLYQLSDLWVNEACAGQGNASRLMDRVEAFLDERRKPGIVVDAIIDGSPAQGMYERRGWMPIPNGLGLHVYNWPHDVPLDVLTGYALR